MSHSVEAMSNVEEKTIEGIKIGIVEDDLTAGYRREQGRVRWHRWNEKQQSTKRACKYEEKKAIKTVKKRAMNGNEKRRRSLSPIIKLVETLSYKSTNYVVSAMRSLSEILRSCADITERRTTAITIINEEGMILLFERVQKQCKVVSLTIAALELFSNLLSTKPFGARCTSSLWCFRKPPSRCWYDLLFEVIKQRDDCFNIAIKALYMLLWEVFNRGTISDRAAEVVFTASADEESLVLTLLSSKVVAVGHALSIYSKITLHGPNIYREDACKVVCSIVIDHAMVTLSAATLSVMTDAVDIIFQLLKNDENKSL